MTVAGENSASPPRVSASTTPEDGAEHGPGADEDAVARGAAQPHLDRPRGRLLGRRCRSWHGGRSAAACRRRRLGVLAHGSTLTGR